MPAISTQLPTEIVEAAFAKAKQQPQLPAAAMEAIEISQDDDCALETLASVIERDPLLAAELLKLASSTLFGGRTRTASVEQAITRIGLKRCRLLLVNAGVSSMMQALPNWLGALRDEVWDHSCDTATAAKAINAKLKLGFGGEEVTVGLMHDIGRVIMGLVTDGDDALALLTSLETADNEEAERANWQFSHSDCAAWLASNARLPIDAIYAIRYHHHPEEAGEFSKLAHLLAAADHISDAILEDPTLEGYDPTENESLVALVESSSAATIDQVVEAVRDSIGEET